MISPLNKCLLCPRQCGADRLAGEIGFCGCDATIKIARAALHMWEEPCISGVCDSDSDCEPQGSGTVFFSGCTLKCVYCQNCNISTGGFGKEITTDRLAEIFLELQQKGALNINLVTPTQYIPQIIAALDKARANGLILPIVYNTSGYERVDSIRLLKGYIDVYLPDFKYMNNVYAKKYSSCSDYVENAKASLDEMVSQVGECVFDENGIIKSGVIVRHLMLPDLLDDSKAVIKYLYERYGDRIYISIMSQYTPLEGLCSLDGFCELKRKLTQSEYDACIDYAISLGLENGFLQEGEAAKESFIPSFNFEGVIPSY